MHDSTEAPDLQSYARALADELPGTWHSQYRDGRAELDQHGPTENVWDMNELAEALASDGVVQDAVLTRDDGTRLYVIPRPHSEEEFLVGAIAPDLPPHAFRGVREPDGILIPDNPYQAAEDIVLDLLPRYDKAAAQAQNNAARPPAAAGAETLVMAWSGRDLVVDRPGRREVVDVLLDLGFVNAEAPGQLTLPGDNPVVQAQTVQSAATTLRSHGLNIDVAVRHASPRTALGASAVVPPTPSSAPTARGR